MSAINPHFQHAHRAAYELPHLVKTLGTADYETILTTDQRQMMGAIQSHAYNATETIASGLAAVGQMLSLVASSQFELEKDQLAGLGDLIKHLAVQVEYLHEVESDMQLRIDQSNAAAARAPATAGSSKSQAKREGGAS